MVSANIPEQWLTNATILRLSDRAYRHHCVLLTWSVSNRTNGVIPGDIDLLQTGITPEGLQEVARAGLLEADGDDWILTQYGKTQTSAEKIEAALDNLRAKSRETSRRHRAKKREQPDGDVTVTSPSESKEEQRKAEQRQEASDEGNYPVDTEHTAWDVVPIPTSPDAKEPDTSNREVLCQRFGCTNRPLPGLKTCTVHTEGQKEFERRRRAQLEALAQRGEEDAA